MDEVSLQDIAELHGTSSETIRYHLKRMGVKLRRVGCTTENAKDKQRGTNHHSWNGGRWRHSSGYVYALARTHPMAVNDYVYEHRLVMERHLLETDPSHPSVSNGYLSRDWVVHHKNGVKNDNRLKNLEVLPRSKHHSWLHFRDEMTRLRELLSTNGIDH